jgi:phage shock protein PspC (stress-responsive transcriptional regulator)/membrane protein implicated in regulation of membrane protease activity
MKKNISINISGIIFHIEEDGYENLRRYLDSINKYFSTFDDSTEIMADIESRIAEIFLSKLNEGKQVITAEDVASLITTMGSVSDFKAAEAEQSTSSSSPPPSSAGYQQGQAPFDTTGYPQPKKFMRDQKRKILGGVCAGAANYLGIDPLFARLVFAALVFSGLMFFPLIIPVCILYVVLWIVIPGSYELTEVEVSKKMYRDLDHKVLGGVSGGIASYFSIDIIAVRVLFIVLGLAGGLGIFLYLILWVVLPEAKTLTDRMQMQGEPVTLSNIESNIKKNQLEPDKEESPLTKILLFPFRLIGVLLQALSRVIGPLAEAIRVLLGVFVVVTGLGLLVGVLATGGIALGIISAGAEQVPWMISDNNDLSIPVDAFMRAFPTWVFVAAFVASIIPPLFIILLGISAIARRMVFRPAVGWFLFATLIVCSVLLAVGIPKIVFSFKEEGEHQIETVYQPTGKRAVLRLKETGLDNYEGASLNLEGHSGKEFRLVQIFRAKGTTRQRAIENAQMVTYNVSQQDSLLIFDSNLTFKPDAIFRAQELDMTLFIPFNTPFKIENGMEHILDEYIEWESRDSEIWEMTDKGLTCVTCPKPTEEELLHADLHDFDELDLHGIFDVRIYNGHEFSVELKGDETEKKKYKIFRSGRKLVIEFDGNKTFNWDAKTDNLVSKQVHISITMPELKKIEATGIGHIDFDKFYEDNLELEIRGPVEVKGDVDAQHVLVNLNGKSSAELRGNANSLHAEVQFASKLKAYDLEAQDAIVEVNGASSAKVTVTHRLEIEEGLASEVDYRGNPEFIERNK